MWERREGNGGAGGHELKSNSMNVQFVQRKLTTLYNYNGLIKERKSLLDLLPQIEPQRNINFCFSPLINTLEFGIKNFPFLK